MFHLYTNFESRSSPWEGEISDQVTCVVFESSLLSLYLLNRYRSSSWEDIFDLDFTFVSLGELLYRSNLKRLVEVYKGSIES